MLVVDRPGWIDANLAMLRAMLEPVVDRLIERRQPSALVTSVGSKVTGAEAGGLLAMLSGKVLGQYDIAPGGEPRLLLVAPNLVAVERELGVVPGRLPALGLPARGDPPRAVHGRAVAARLRHG